VESVENLEIWQQGVALVKSLYQTTRSWPDSERYGLVSQVRRAAVSIPANIAEGVGRGTPRESAHFAQISLGSLYELDTLLYLAKEIGLSPCGTTAELRQQLTTLARRLSSFIKYQKRDK